MMTKKRPPFVLFLAAAASHVWAVDELALSTDQQKASYAIGLEIAQSLVRQGVSIDTEALSLAVKDVLSGREPRLPAKELQAVLERQQEKINQERQAAGEKNKAASEAFLAENKKKEGVQVLPSGVQYRVLEEGKGAKPKPADTVKVHYRGTLIDGREFDSSHRRGEPATLPVNGVIQGWQEVLPMMQEGAKWQIFVPSQLAYGERGAGAIGPYETLIFDIELIAVNPPGQ